MKLALFVLALMAVAAAQEKQRLFVTDSQSWEIAGGFGATNGIAAGAVKGGARPQTVEVIKTFSERCPSVIVTMDKSGIHHTDALRSNNL